MCQNVMLCFQNAVVCAKNKEKSKKYEKSWQNIWTIQKTSVSLHREKLRKLKFFRIFAAFVCFVEFTNCLAFY